MELSSPRLSMPYSTFDKSEGCNRYISVADVAHLNRQISNL